MSGTSMDGIDAALVCFGDHSGEIVRTHKQEYPRSLRQELGAIVNDPQRISIDQLGRVDHRVAQSFADAAMAVLESADEYPARVRAIGSHGQTIRHCPDDETPFSIQIGDPNVIAARTKLITVADFRRADMAAGGQGAPLAPAFHHWLFGTAVPNSVVLNIGGFANITTLTPNSDEVVGFDTGPGNTLLDAWIRHSKGLPFDDAGSWAASGEVLQPLLKCMLDDAYFVLEPPKSTGFEYFNLAWLQRCIADTAASEHSAADVQATLVELTAISISTAVTGAAPAADRLLACGGGVHNNFLMDRLASNCQSLRIDETTEFGIDADWVEAAAFAWLARQTLNGNSGNLPSVTGATKKVALGSIFSPTT